jgi:DedD protein
MTTDIERGGMDVGGSHEPSYYEIALTNRQVVVAFVILLTCVVAAFFSGVWIGRESSARAQERMAMLARGHGADGSEGANGADKEKPDGQALQEFKFFADPRNHPAANAKGDNGAGGAAGANGRQSATGNSGGGKDAKGAAGAPARSTLAEDLSRRTGSPAAAASVPAAPPAAPPVRSAAARRALPPPDTSTPPNAATAPNAANAHGSASAVSAANTADTAPAGEGEPLPAAPAPSARSGARSKGSSGASTGGTAGTGASGASGASAASGKKPAITWSPSAGSPDAVAPGEVVIQVFSTADKDQADKVRDGLVESGFTAFLSPIAKGGQTMYRVRIGPFPSRSAAEAVAEKVRKERKLDTWITPK